MSLIERDLRDLENAAVLLEETTEEYVNPPTAESMRDAATDVRRIAANLHPGAVEALVQARTVLEGIAPHDDKPSTQARVTEAMRLLTAAIGGQ